jgi:hypothetical protein
MAAPKLANNRPSGFSRTIGCPGSRRLMALAPAGKSSVYAEQGSAAHDLVYKCLTTGSVPIEHMGTYIHRAEKWLVDDDMVKATTFMVQWCRMLLKHPKLVWSTIEERLTIPYLDMPKGGTADFACLLGDQKSLTAHMVDYKHGAGVYVGVDGNPQFMCYGHGVANTAPAELIRKVDKWRLTCIQPRHEQGPPIRHWDTDPKGMSDWLNNIAVPAVEISREPDAPLVVGDWCRFCPADRVSCNAKMELALAGMRKITE